MSERKIGTVKWFNNRKGYGFIELEGMADVFVHHTSIKEEGYRTLLEGQRVEFTLKENGDKGPAAEDVTKI